MLSAPAVALAVLHRVEIHLADNEWDNALMLTVAQEYARAHAERPLRVVVHEHGGWALSWTFEPGDWHGVITGSANDRAQWGEQATALREKYYHARINYLDCIRRGKEAA